MRNRLAVIIACLLVALGCIAAPALAAGHAKTTSTTSTTTTTHRAPAAGHHSTTTSKSTSKSKAKSSSKKHPPKKHGVPAKKHITGSASSIRQATAVLNDCQSHGQLTHDYTKAELHKALQIMSASTEQYSNCSDVIHQALLHGIKTGDINDSGGSGSTTTIVIIVVVVLVLLAAIFGGLAYRRRRGGGGGDAPPPAPAA